MRIALLFPVITAIACGDNLGDPTAPQSGARLKLLRYAYEDGTIEVERGLFYDRFLDARCYPTIWSDGARYCTPLAGEAVFVDAGCAAVLGRVVAGGAAPRFFAVPYEVTGDPIPRPSRLLPAGAPGLAPPQTWKRRDGLCLGSEPDTLTYDYYSVGEPIDIEPTRLRHGEPIGGERLGDIYATSGDGLRVAVGVHDRALALDCTLGGNANAATGSCVPRDVDTYLSYFTDPACTAPVVPIYSAATPAVAIHERPGTGCVDYYRVTSEVAVAALYQSVNDLCVPASLSSTRYLGAERLALADLPRQVAGGANRLRPIDLGGLAVPDPLLHDSTLDADCERTELASGAIRCVPSTPAQVRELFADAACQTPLDVALVPARECDAPIRFARGAQMHRVVEPYAAPIYELTTGDRCGVFPTMPGFVPHAIGPALPATTFAAATLVIDP